MTALLTSCARFDLLNKTLISLYENQQSKFFLTINEDGLTKIGQHASIENFLKTTNEKYYLHLECDWQFENSYDWIQSSIDLMNHDPMVIKVLARKESPHPCEHNLNFNNIKFGYIKPWENNGITWHGFSWNPGVTRMDLLRQFMPFPKWEQDLAQTIYEAGYKVIELAEPVYHHIGDGMSTHE